MKKEKFLQEVNRLKGNTKLSQAKKYSFGTIDEVETEFRSLEDSMYAANEAIDRVNNALEELDSINVYAMGTFVDVAEKLREVEAVSEEMGFDFRQVLSDDVINNLDRFGDVADNNNTTVNDLLNAAGTLEQI